MDLVRVALLRVEALTVVVRAGIQLLLRKKLDIVSSSSSIHNFAFSTLIVIKARSIFTSKSVEFLEK